MSDLRVGGLVSGTDVQGIVDKILAVRARPLISMNEDIAEINEQIAAWADINTDMTALTDAADKLRFWDTWNQMQATSSDETRLQATATTAAVPGVYQIEIDRLAQAHSISSDRAEDLNPGSTSTTDLVDLGILNEGDSFTIEGHTVTIGAVESLESLKNKINLANTDIPAADQVTAIIMDNRLVITRKNTGSDEMAMAEDSGNPLQALGIFSAPATYNAANVLVQAQDAQFYVNGAQVNRDNNTALTDVLPGVTLNLKGATFSHVTLTIGRDKETAKLAILDFIDMYNAAATKIDSYTKVLVNTDGSGSASVSQVGLLHKDSLAREILGNMRKYAMDSKFPDLNQINAAYTYNGRDGVCDNLQAIGIGTSSRENQLTITDESRLNYMLEHNYDKVEQLFRGIYDSEQGYQHGVATDFYKYSDSISASMTGAIAQRDGRLDDQIADINIRMTRLEKMIDEEERRLWGQFGAMEDAISKMQSQLSYVVGQLGMS